MEAADLTHRLQNRLGAPTLARLRAGEPVLWPNPDVLPSQAALSAASDAADSAAYPSPSEADIADATARLQRFAPYIAAVFPETSQTLGVIESPVVAVPHLQRQLGAGAGHLWLKLDSHLPISGSIKARGGIYEVLRHAEALALDAGLITADDDYRRFADPAFTEFFGRYSVSVGSTGNLGLSIGIMAAKLGFSTTVHMSADARQWKKDRLRHDGVEVVEYEGDYSVAVAAGRERAQGSDGMGDPSAHFIDDENSPSLFLGYAVAAHRLQAQLEALDVVIDEDHPLFLHLPCGVGGGPGGITFGAKHAFGDAVHCIFVEPTHSPSMLLGLSSGLGDQVSVEAVGMDNATAADGLACARPSGFVAHTVRHLVDACATVTDERMFELLAMLHDSEDIDIEPSSTVGIDSFARLAALPATDPYRQRMHLTDERMAHATHVAWATGGSMVPKDEMAKYIARGR